MNRNGVLATLFLLGALVSSFLVQDQLRENKFQEAPRASKGGVTVSRRPPELVGDGRLTLAQRMEKLSIEELIERIPEVPERSWKNYKARALFRRLGEVLGEQAIDEIVNRYGSGKEENPDHSFALRAIGWALAGWMKRDVEEASLVFLRLQRELKSELREYPRAFLEWKGTQLIIPSGYGFAHGCLVLPAVEEASAVDPEVGLDLISQMPGPSSFVDLYTRNLGRHTDWTAVDKQLRELVWGANPLLTGQDNITVAVARGWVQWDVEKALNWFFERNRGSKKSRVSLATQVLRSASDPVQAVEWLRANEASALEVDL